jgi:uracil-DNA glycosylase family 4
MPEAITLTPELLNLIPYRRGNATNPKYIFIGIAPGKDELADDLKRAFIGYSGRLLDNKLINGVGISMAECYFTNVIKERVLGDKHDIWIKENPKTFETYIRLLTAELNLVSPTANVIVPLGDIPLRIICNKKGITNWRGSIISSTIIPNKKCIPTIHPASILRTWSQLTYVKEDFKRIKVEAETPDIILPKRTYIIRPSFDLAIERLNYYATTNRLVSVDIETTRTIASIQFSDDKDIGFCLPLQHKNGSSYWTPSQEAILWRIIYRILTTRKLIGQNFERFDSYVINFHGIPYKKVLAQVYMDTMEAFSCLQPELPKSLQFLTSVYTREPFYKAEGKEWSTREGEDEFFTYGCKDVCTVSEIAPQIEEELKEVGLWDFYIKRYRGMAIPRMMQSVRGMRVDLKKREQLSTEYTKEIVKTQCEITVLAGANINVNSHKQMKTLFYETMKLPKQYKDNKITCDEDAILTLSTKSSSAIFPHIIKQRNQRLLKSNNIDCRLDSDNRFRTSLGFTETGRFTSSKTPLNTGSNSQNITKKMRVMFIPDDGKVLVNVDQSQAEARVVAWRGMMYKTIELFLDPTRDIHIETAIYIFKILKENVRRDFERYTAKRVRHAVNYGMQDEKFAKVYNKDAADMDLPFLNVLKAHEYMAGFHTMEPNLKAVYQREIAELVRKNKTLYNPFGRRTILHDRIGDDLFRSAWAWYAQSVVGDITNIIYEQVYNKWEILNQGHDAILFQCCPYQVADLIADVRKVGNIELDICPDKTIPKLVIPLDFETGPNWLELNKYVA